MKKLLFAASLLIGAVVHSAEYPRNPDRVPSIGLTYAGMAETGDVTLNAGSATAKQDIENVNGQFLLDLRLPVSDNVTFNGSLGFIGSEFTADETPLLNGQKSSMSGVGFSVGVRFYLQ